MRISQMTQEQKDKFIPKYKRELISIAGIMGIDGILEILAELASEMADEQMDSEPIEGLEFLNSSEITSTYLAIAAQISHACDEIRKSLDI